MRALWLHNQELSVRTDLPRPETPHGEALVRVSLAGICNTDLEMLNGYYPFAGTLGHEFVGRVEESPYQSEWVGKRVVGEINAVCHTCIACTNGRPTHCEHRTVLGIHDRNGAFAEYLTLPVENLHEVPDNVTDDVAVFTEPTAAAFGIQAQLEISPDDRVVVIGSGKLGYLIAQTLVATDCVLTVVGRRPKSLELFRSQRIRTALATELQEDVADIVVECTGNPSGLDLALKAVRPRGTIVLKSTYAGKAELDVSRIVVDEITLVGSRCGPFAPARDALTHGTSDVRARAGQGGLRARDATGGREDSLGLQ